MMKFNTFEDFEKVYNHLLSLPDETDEEAAIYYDYFREADYALTDFIITKYPILEKYIDVWGSIIIDVIDYQSDLNERSLITELIKIYQVPMEDLIDMSDDEIIKRYIDKNI